MDIARRFAPIAEAIATLLQPHAEVVVHDLGSDRIVHISNPFSGRRPGDASLIDALPEDGDSAAVLGPYLKHDPDGRTLRSVTAVLRDDDGRAAAMLCINLDVTQLAQARAVLGTLIDPVDRQRPAALFNSDWREAVNTAIAAYLAAHDRAPGNLRHADHPALIATLDREGVFAVRHAVPYVAEVLGISRATVYKHLKHSRAADASAERTP